MGYLGPSCSRVKKSGDTPAIVSKLNVLRNRARSVPRFFLSRDREGALPRESRRSHECERGTHECVRYIVLLLLASVLEGAVVIDRMAVIVGQHVIKASDVDRDLRLTEFMNREPL